MPKGVPFIPFTDFSGGMCSADAPTRHAPNEWASLENLRYSIRGMEKRPGYVKADSAAVEAASDIRQIFLHYGATGTQTMLAASQAGLSEGVGSGWTLRKSVDLTSLFPDGVQIGNGYYLALGTGALQYWEPGAATMDVGFAAPTGAGVAALAGAGLDHTGTYYYVYTYVREVAGAMVWESNPSPWSNGIAAAAQKIQLQSLPADGPANSTHYYIYRLKFGYQQEFKYVAKFDWTTLGTTWDDNVADGAETTLCSGLAYAGTYSHGVPPPAATCACEHGGYLMLGAGRRLYVSNPLRPWSFDAAHYIDVAERGERFLRIIEWNGTLYCLCSRSVVAVLPDPGAAVPWRTYRYPVRSGCIAPRGVAAIDQAIYWVSRAGIIEWTGSGIGGVVSLRINDYFTEITGTRLRQASLAAYDHRLRLAITDGTDYNAASWVGDLSVRTYLERPEVSQAYQDQVPQPAWTLDTSPASIGCFAIGDAAWLGTVDSHLYAGNGNPATDGFVYRLDTGDDDLAGNIQAKIARTSVFGSAYAEKHIDRIRPHVFPTGIAADVLTVTVTVDGTALTAQTVSLAGTSYGVPVSCQMEFPRDGRCVGVEMKQNNKDELATGRRPIFLGMEMEVSFHEARP